MWVIAIFDTMQSCEDQLHYFADDDGSMYVYASIEKARDALSDAIDDMIPSGASRLFTHYNRADSISAGYEYDGYRYNCSAVIERCCLIVD